MDKQPSYLKHKLISFVMLVASSLLLLMGLVLWKLQAPGGWLVGLVSAAAAFCAVQTTVR